MNYPTIILGLLFGGLGVYTLILKLQKKYEAFSKLDKMKKYYGEKAGAVVHFVGYTILPITIGLYCIIGGILGVNIFEY